MTQLLSQPPTRNPSPADGLDLPHFIETERGDLPGEVAELEVWEHVKSAFAKRQCLAYWHYPIFRKNATGKEPDILILDKELGLILLEVKGIRNEQLVRLEGERWHYRNFYQDHGYPYRQGKAQLQALLEKCQNEPLLQKLMARVLVALPFITSEEWLRRGYYDLPLAPPVLCEDNLGKASLLNTIKDASLVSYGEPLSDEGWHTLLRTLSGMSFGKTYNKPIEHYQGRAGLLQVAKRQQHRFDLSQEIIAKQIPPGPQRIRGIAGSGKTVLLCQKAAQMHLKHPDWDIAFVFHTRSLYDLILNQLNFWVEHFTGGEQGYDPHNSKLKVLHAWGSREQPGFYRTVSFANGVKALTLDDIPKSQQGSPPQNLAYVVASLLGELERRNKKLKPCFDAVLVDEGQDLVVGEKYKYQDKQPFYNLAFRSLRPAKLAAQAQALFENATVNETAEGRRLIWAYDEAQSLDSLVVPSYKEIFGEELSGAILTGGVSYPGGIAKHQVIERCYRTPGQILVAAHALGMGLLRKEGILSALTTKEDWGKLGYEVEGDFRRTGSTIVLRRPRRNSPNAVPELYGRSTLAFHAFNNRRDELETVTAQLLQDLEEGLNPSRDVLVIVLGQYHDAKRLQEYFAEVLQSQGINFFVPGAKAANVVNPKFPDNDPNSFWFEGAVTISPVHQAKGNEADVVYILGLDHLSRHEADSAYRNQLFVALTRSRGFAHVSGVGENRLFEELRDVMRMGETLTFTFQRQPRRFISDE